MELNHETHPEVEEELAVTLADHLKSETFNHHLEAILPKHLSSERFVSICMRQLSVTPELQRCTLRSVIGSMMTAATLGLEVGTQGECFLIPYKRECTLQIGVWGHSALAWRSGLLADLQFDVVMKGDRFDFQKGTDAYLHHIPEEGRDLGNTGEIDWVYAVARMTNGGKIFDAFDKAWIERIRSRSQAPNSPAWVEFYAEQSMAKALKKVLKLCPKSREMGHAITIDDQSDAGVRQVFEVDTSFLLPAEVATDPRMEAARERMRSAGADPGRTPEAGKGGNSKPRRAPGPEKAGPQPPGPAKAGAEEPDHGLRVEDAQRPQEAAEPRDEDAPPAEEEPAGEGNQTLGW